MTAWTLNPNSFLCHTILHCRFAMLRMCACTRYQIFTIARFPKILVYSPTAMPAYSCQPYCTAAYLTPAGPTVLRPACTPASPTTLRLAPSLPHSSSLTALRPACRHPPHATLPELPKVQNISCNKSTGGYIRPCSLNIQWFTQYFVSWRDTLTYINGRVLSGESGSLDAVVAVQSVLCR